MAKYNEDFTTISAEIIEQITQLVDKLNCDLVFVCRENNYPDDYDKLFKVIGKYKTPHKYFDGQYAVWTASFYGSQPSLCHGTYHTSFKNALKIIADRMIDCNKDE